MSWILTWSHFETSKEARGRFRATAQSRSLVSSQHWNCPSAHQWCVRRASTQSIPTFQELNRLNPKCASFYLSYFFNWNQSGCIYCRGRMVVWSPSGAVMRSSCTKATAELQEGRANLPCEQKVIIFLHSTELNIKSCSEFWPECEN